MLVDIFSFVSVNLKNVGPIIVQMNLNVTHGYTNVFFYYIRLNRIYYLEKILQFRNQFDSKKNVFKLSVSI